MCNYRIKVDSGRCHLSDYMGLIKKINEHVSLNPDKTQFYSTTYFLDAGFKINNYSCWNNNNNHKVLFRKLDLEIDLRKKSNKKHTPLYIITSHEWFINSIDVSECNKLNVFFIVLSDSKIKSDEEFSVLTYESYKNLVFETNSDTGSFVLPLTYNSYNINTEFSTIVKTSNVSLDYVLTIDQLIFAVENEHLMYSDEEVKRVVNSNSKEECLNLLIGKKEILGLINV